MTQRRWAIASILLSLLLMAGFVVVYTGYTRERDDQRWCGLFAALDPAAEPPTTDRGAEVQRLIRQLRADFDCRGKDTPR